MNPAIEVKSEGTRSRFIPASRSGTSVVPASTMLVDAPIVALAMMFHDAHRPSWDTEMPSISTCSPEAMNGIRKANAMNGTSVAGPQAVRILAEASAPPADPAGYLRGLVDPDIPSEPDPGHDPGQVSSGRRLGKGGLPAEDRIIR